MIYSERQSAETPEPQQRVLIIDDEVSNLDIVTEFLEEHDFEILVAEDGHIGLKRARLAHPDVILLDVLMPGLDGFEVCRRLKADAETQDIPVIFMTALAATENKVKGFAAGAVDYVTKPYQREEILSRVAVHLELKRYRDHLEALVQRRTQELQQSNDRLKQSLDDLKQEIEQREQVQSIVEANEAKLSAVVDAFQGFLYTCNMYDYRLDFVNQDLKEWIGSSKTSTSCHEAVFGLNQPCQWCGFKDVEQGASKEMEVENPKNGRWYHMIQSPVFTHEGVVCQKQTILVDITRRKQKEKALQEHDAQLKRENERLRASMRDRYRFGDIIGKSEAMQAVYESILKAAATDANVIIHGESGTGKELVAKQIHHHSKHGKGPMISVNCSAIPLTLAESEFFGHRKGTFTGAERDKIGFLKMAEHGSLFLDEIGDISLDLQVKLLRAIEGEGFRPVGSKELIKTDFRLIAATNKDLQAQLQKGLMREDFYYRIHVIPIHLPPLRERKEDIPLLAEYFFHEFDPKGFRTLTGKLMDTLQHYAWPGNVRELKNALYRFVTMNELDLNTFSSSQHSLLNEFETLGITQETPTVRAVLETIEKRLILKALQQHHWHRGKTAEAIGMDSKTLYRKIKYYRLSDSQVSQSNSSLP